MCIYKRIIDSSIFSFFMNRQDVFDHKHNTWEITYTCKDQCTYQQRLCYYYLCTTLLQSLKMNRKSPTSHTKFWFNFFTALNPCFCSPFNSLKYDFFSPNNVLEDLGISLPSSIHGKQINPSHPPNYWYHISSS